MLRRVHTMSVDHSPAGPAAGFEQQRQLALVLLCEAYGRDPSVKVRLEAVEDIDIVSDVIFDRRARAGQAPPRRPHAHRLDPQLWRTLTVWMDLAESLPSGALPHLHLATTSSAHPESAAAVLGPEGRDVEAALGRLLKAGAEGTANTTQAARHRFVALERAKQLQILQAVTVLDTTVHVTDLHSRLRTALGLVVPSERLDEFLDRLQGW